MSFDLDSLSIKELKNLDAKIAKAISGLENKRKLEAIAALEEQAKAFGFTLEELAPISRQRRQKASGGQRLDS